MLGLWALTALWASLVFFVLGLNRQLLEGIPGAVVHHHRVAGLEANTPKPPERCKPHV